MLLLEIGPMLRLIVWRRSLAQGIMPATTPASRSARVSMIQAVLVLMMVAAATGMARGFGAM